MPIDKWFIPQYMKEQEAKAEKALDIMAAVVESEAKIRVTVDTGNLRGSITTDKERLVRGIGSNVEYAPFIEHGTEKQEAQPFLKPALDDNIGKLKKLFVRIMRK